MAAGRNQKQKLLYLAKIFFEETDERHGLTLQEIIRRLAAYEVNAERKTLYSDLEELREFGMDILREQVGRNVYYHLASRDFELPELKLLVDSVQSAKFISERKSRLLIKKLESLVSRHDAGHLHRQVVISGRVKTMNESVYYTVDALHEAINAGRQIRFQYYQWTVQKTMELRRSGAWYQVSPWALIWDDEYYYLAAYDSSDGLIKHYRVDKMLHLTVTEQRREGQEAFQRSGDGQNGSQLFGMFGGEVTRVTLEGENRMAGVLIDRFGKELAIHPTDETHFSARVDVVVSQNFLGWIFALGDAVRITSPDSVVAQMWERARKLSELYPDRSP